MTTSDIIEKILINRKIVNESERLNFLNPPHPNSIKSPFDIELTSKKILDYINKGSKIAIYSDYDVDGICSAAILFESLSKITPKVFPYIPKREEGYGLSQKGIDECISKGASLIISADCGIVSEKEIAYAKSKDVDFVVIDHHQIDQSNTPPTNTILHSQKYCAAALCWFLVRDMKLNNPNHLELAGIATICDMIPLIEENRSIAKHALISLRTTTRVGLNSLFVSSAIKKDNSGWIVGSYEVGYLIGPRLNSTGRLDHALNSLRLICTTNSSKSQELANLLNDTNSQRQDTTTSSLKIADAEISNNSSENILVTASSEYNPGVIGLIASKITEKYYKPSIVISIIGEICKGSARSISGFDITKELRNLSQLLTSVGGHSMAAGFSLPTANLEELTQKIKSVQIDSSLLKKTFKYDLELDISDLSLDLAQKISEFEPFGIGNPKPVFKSKGLISEIKKIGKSLEHLAFRFSDQPAIYFKPQDIDQINNGEYIAMYSLDIDTFSGYPRTKITIKKVEKPQVDTHDNQIGTI